MDNLKTLIEPALKEKGCMLYELEWDTKMKPPILRVMIDREDEPIDLDICAECSEALSVLLDEADTIPGEYMLEVCSPGAERLLKTEKQIQNQVGKYVRIELIQEQDHVKEIFGKLDAADENELKISTFIKGRPKKYQVRRDNIAHIRSAVKV